MPRTIYKPFFLLSIFSLLAFLSSCGTPPTSASNNGLVPLPTASTTTSSPTTSTAPVQTTCPAAGTARGAVMPASKQGSHPALLYVYNQQNTSTLRAYNVTNGQKTDILKATAANNDRFLQSARLSADGQWAIFRSVVENKDALQMVRVDGQELQTLYCTSSTDHIAALSWSPNQKYLVFSQYGQAITLYTLDMTSGMLRTTLKPVNYIGYEPVKWRSNTSIYVTGAALGVGGGPGPIRNRRGLYLLQDVTRDANQQSTNLQQIKLPDPPQSADPECRDFDVSPDFTHIVYSDCVFGGTKPTLTGPGTINMMPAAGGTAHVVHNDPTHAITFARFISNSTLLFYIGNATYLSPAPPSSMIQNGFWIMNTDGSGLKRLTTAHTDEYVELDLLSYTPWTNISSDGTMYAYWSVSGANTGNATSTMSLFYGSFKAGPAKSFASTSITDGSINLIGWTML